MQRNNSSSVSSNIAEFIPMRSIIKNLKLAKKRKKSVKFADMVLIGDDGDQI